MSTTSNQRSWLFPFGSRRAEEPPHQPAHVTIEMIGRECSGKTALFETVHKSLFQGTFGSGLQFSIGDPRRVAALIQQAREKLSLMRGRGLPSTWDPHISEYTLCEGEREQVILQFREVIGQILSRTTMDSPPEEQAQYEEYLSHLAEADVLWVIVPVPGAEATGSELARYQEDLNLNSAYLREALKNRRSPKPCTVALVLSKTDILFPTVQEARERLTEACLLDLLLPLATTLRHSKKVDYAGIFPISAFGYGRAMLQTETAMDEEDDARSADPIYVIKPNEAPCPDNLTALVLWSLMGAMLNMEVTSDGDEEPEMARVCRLLSQDLHDHDAWYVPLKETLG